LSVRADPCGCFPTGRHYPGIAHLVKVRVAGVATEIEGATPWLEVPIAFLDVETTGRDPQKDRVIELGIIVGTFGTIDKPERHGWLINPGVPVSAESSAVHGITDADLVGKPTFQEIAPLVLAALEGRVPAAYNAEFDRSFLLAELERAGVRPDAPPPAVRRDIVWLDPLTFARELYKEEESRALGEMAARLGIQLENAHRATDDAEAALRVLYAFAKDPRVPKTYAGVVQEQRRLGRIQGEARRMWRKN
jgi:DNA polymerase-3 subunit epsilon